MQGDAEKATSRGIDDYADIFLSPATVFSRRDEQARDQSFGVLRFVDQSVPASVGSDTVFGTV